MFTWGLGWINFYVFGWDIQLKFFSISNIEISAVDLHSCSGESSNGEDCFKNSPEELINTQDTAGMSSIDLNNITSQIEISEDVALLINPRMVNGKLTTFSEYFENSNISFDKSVEMWEEICGVEKKEFVVDEKEIRRMASMGMDLIDYSLISDPKVCADYNKYGSFVRTKAYREYNLTPSDVLEMSKNSKITNTKNEILESLKNSETLEELVDCFGYFTNPFFDTFEVYDFNHDKRLYISKIYIPRPFSASSEDTQKGLPWHIDFVHLSYWFFFLSVVLSVLFLMYFFSFIWNNQENKLPVRETRGFSRAQFGDTMTAVIPMTWSITMLFHASTHSNNFDENTTGTQFCFSIVAYQWGWNYYYPRDIVGTFNSLPIKVGNDSIDYYANFNDNYKNLFYLYHTNLLLKSLSLGRGSSKLGKNSIQVLQSLFFKPFNYTQNFKLPVVLFSNLNLNVNNELVMNDIKKYISNNDDSQISFFSSIFNLEKNNHLLNIFSNIFSFNFFNINKIYNYKFYFIERNFINKDISNNIFINKNFFFSFNFFNKYYFLDSLRNKNTFFSNSNKLYFAYNQIFNNKLKNSNFQNINSKNFLQNYISFYEKLFDEKPIEATLNGLEEFDLYSLRFVTFWNYNIMSWHKKLEFIFNDETLFWDDFFNFKFFGLDIKKLVINDFVNINLMDYNKNIFFNKNIISMTQNFIYLYYIFYSLSIDNSFMYSFYSHLSFEDFNLTNNSSAKEVFFYNTQNSNFFYFNLFKFFKNNISLNKINSNMNFYNFFNKSDYQNFWDNSPCSIKFNNSYFTNYFNTVNKNIDISLKFSVPFILNNSFKLFKNFLISNSLILNLLNHISYDLIFFDKINLLKNYKNLFYLYSNDNIFNLLLFNKYNYLNINYITDVSFENLSDDIFSLELNYYENYLVLRYLNLVYNYSNNYLYYSNDYFFNFFLTSLNNKNNNFMFFKFSNYNKLYSFTNFNNDILLKKINFNFKLNFSKILITYNFNEFFYIKKFNLLFNYKILNSKLLNINIWNFFILKNNVNTNVITLDKPIRNSIKINDPQILNFKFSNNLSSIFYNNRKLFKWQLFWSNNQKFFNLPLYKFFRGNIEKKTIFGFSDNKLNQLDVLNVGTDVNVQQISIFKNFNNNFSIKKNYFINKNEFLDKKNINTLKFSFFDVEKFNFNKNYTAVLPSVFEDIDVPFITKYLTFDINTSRRNDHLSKYKVFWGSLFNKYIKKLSFNDILNDNSNANIKHINFFKSYNLNLLKFDSFYLNNISFNKNSFSFSVNFINKFNNLNVNFLKNNFIFFYFKFNFNSLNIFNELEFTFNGSSDIFYLNNFFNLLESSWLLKDNIQNFNNKIFYLKNFIVNIESLQKLLVQNSFKQKELLKFKNFDNSFYFNNFINNDLLNISSEYLFNIFNDEKIKNKSTNIISNHVKNLYYNYFLNNSNYKNNFRFDFKEINNNISAIKRLRVSKGICLPSDYSIHIICSSKDVIHSWAIPGLGIKIDAIPGFNSHRRVIFRWRGVYWGQCMEVCGRYHHWMPILVKIVHKDSFLLWCLTYIRLTNSKNIKYERLLFNEIVLYSFLNDEKNLEVLSSYVEYLKNEGHNFLIY